MQKDYEHPAEFVGVLQEGLVTLFTLLWLYKDTGPDFILKCCSIIM